MVINTTMPPPHASISNTSVNVKNMSRSYGWLSCKRISRGLLQIEFDGKIDTEKNALEDTRRAAKSSEARQRQGESMAKATRGPELA